MPSANVTEALDYLTEAMLGIGDVFLLVALILIPMALTFAMFHSRDLLLGFPSAIFWAILGGYCYQQSTVTWDIYYFVFFASMGMVIFCLVAMYALREKDLSEPEPDKTTFFDEETEPDLRGDIGKGKEGDEFQPSDRAKRIRDRADRRRLRKRIAGKMGGR